MTKVLSLQQLRRALQQSDQKVFVFDSENQPGFDCTNPISVRMYCWFSEVWPQTETVVMKSNNGELCLRRVDHIVELKSQGDAGTVYTIYCRDVSKHGRSSAYTFREFQ